MVSVIIPSFQRPYVLAGSLMNLINQTAFKKYQFEILVTIDESDKNVDIYHDLISQINKIYKASNLRGEIKLLINKTKGLIEAKNRALEKAMFNYIMMLDDDLFPEADYIEALLKDINNDDIGAVSGFIVTYKPAISHTQPSSIVTKLPKTSHLQTLKINNGNGKWRSIFGKKEQVMDWSKMRKLLKPRKRFVMDYFVNSYLFKKDIGIKIGGYNQKLNSATSAHEEVDFTFRINRAGYKLLFNPQIRMWHMTIGSGGIYKGQNWEKSKKIMEKEYKKSLPIFLRSISN